MTASLRCAFVEAIRRRCERRGSIHERLPKTHAHTHTHIKTNKNTHTHKKKKTNKNTHTQTNKQTNKQTKHTCPRADTDYTVTGFALFNMRGGQTRRRSLMGLSMAVAECQPSRSSERRFQYGQQRFRQARGH